MSNISHCSGPRQTNLGSLQLENVGHGLGTYTALVLVSSFSRALAGSSCLLLLAAVAAAGVLDAAGFKGVDFVGVDMVERYGNEGLRESKGPKMLSLFSWGTTTFLHGQLDGNHG